MADSRKEQIMAHLSASSDTKLDIPSVAQNPGGMAPQPLCDDATYNRRMEHVARSLGNFYKKERTPAQIIEHLNMTSGK